MGAPNTLRRFSHGKGICGWCGQIRRRVFSYGGLRGTFCNFECCGSYHDINRHDFDYFEYEPEAS